MNKKWWLPLVIVGVVLVVLGITAAVIFGIVVSNITKEKTSISSYEFINKIEEAGYESKDVKSQFSSYNYIISATLAIDPSYTYQIEFYELDSNENAMKFFELNKEKFMSQASKIISSRLNLNGKNYNTFLLNSDGKYRYIARIDNTCIYANVDNAYKKNIESLIKELGY